MGQDQDKGQAAGTASALRSQRGLATRELLYEDLKTALIENGVHLESVVEVSE